MSDTTANRFHREQQYLGHRKDSEEIQTLLKSRQILWPVATLWIIGELKLHASLSSNLTGEARL